MFKVTSIAVTPPKGAISQPALPPELLASVLAKYSRSNEGLDTILSKVDLDQPEASIERILKFVDYGHASIGGLTGGIAIAIDGVTMWLAYKLFEFSPYADGQESSTRYIPMEDTSLPNWEQLGFTEAEAVEMVSLAVDGMQLYESEKARLDSFAQETPDVICYPAGANDKAKQRIRVNYGLDRARYTLPFALKTNIALVQTARAWCNTISALLSLPQPEAQQVGEALKVELAKFAPNLAKHARHKPGYVEYHAALERNVHRRDRSIAESVQVELMAFADDPRDLALERLRLRENRYDMCPPQVCASTVRVHWPRMAIAELRDLNRHRTGHRASTLRNNGFYFPDELVDEDNRACYHGREDWEQRVNRLLSFRDRAHAIYRKHINNPVTRPYTLFLGTQTDFTHTLQLDKFVYEAELRTGPGAHFRYAEHIREAVALLDDRVPGLMSSIHLGEAEPE